MGTAATAQGHPASPPAEHRPPGGDTQAPPAAAARPAGGTTPPEDPRSPEAPLPPGPLTRGARSLSRPVPHSHRRPRPQTARHVTRGRIGAERARAGVLRCVTLGAPAREEAASRAPASPPPRDADARRPLPPRAVAEGRPLPRSAVAAAPPTWERSSRAAGTDGGGRTAPAPARPGYGGGRGGPGAARGGGAAALFIAPSLPPPPATVMATGEGPSRERGGGGRGSWLAPRDCWGRAVAARSPVT